MFGIFFFLFCLDLGLFEKIKKDLVSTHWLSTLLLITQDLKKIKKIPTTLLKTLLSRKRVQKFQQKILNFVAAGTRQSFQFFTQIAWFLGNNRTLSKLRYRILYNLISITKLHKNHSIKANFNLTTPATLTWSQYKYMNLIEATFFWVFTYRKEIINVLYLYFIINHLKRK